MKCPFCSEDIQNDAVKCRFCGEWLDTQKFAAGTEPVDGKTEPVKIAQTEEMVFETQRLPVKETPYPTKLEGRVLVINWIVFSLAVLNGTIVMPEVMSEAKALDWRYYPANLKVSIQISFIFFPLILLIVTYISKSKVADIIGFLISGLCCAIGVLLLVNTVTFLPGTRGIGFVEILFLILILICWTAILGLGLLNLKYILLRYRAKSLY